MINFLKAISVVLVLSLVGCATSPGRIFELPGVSTSAGEESGVTIEQRQEDSNPEDPDAPHRTIRGQDFGYENGRITSDGEGDQTQTGPLPTNDATKPSQQPSPRVARLPNDPYFPTNQNSNQSSFAPQNGSTSSSGPQFVAPQNVPGPGTQVASQTGFASGSGPSTVYGPSTTRNFGPPPYNNPPYGTGPYADRPGGALELPPNFADINAIVSEGQSGQIMLGAAVNSDAGVTGQLTISEKNFDITNYPRSFRDMFIDGNAFRGNGQGFRLEAMPGNQVQRYLINFTEPYLFNTQISLSTSGYYFTRNYFDYNEQRLGGRVALGYRLTPDLSMSVGTRMENVKVFDPRVNTSDELNRALGSSSLFLGQFTLAHDTRDHAFLATEGHYFELGFQQGFGTFDYPRGDLDYRRYFLIRERPDGSGRHTVTASTKVGVTGPDTPIFENYFAGGFSTLRGFDFRGASPVQSGVQVGGKFSFINSVEYMFPLTADDMIRGVLFCDYGTVEQSVKFDADTFRVAPGFGFRINLPFAGSGGAPLAFDFAFPVAKADTDDTRVFSFNMSAGR